MTKENLADLIHEWNIDCKSEAKRGRDCNLCRRLAGHVLILMGLELQKEGLKRNES